MFPLNLQLTNTYYHNHNRSIEHTGYTITRTNGQQIYSSPNHVNPPPKGCEIFFGKIPRNMFEDELIPIFNKLGNIYQMRLMMEFNGLNRGFGFVTYFKPDVANAAVALLNGCQLRSGHKMGVFKSVDNCRLFVGGIPPEKTKEEIHEALSQYVDGIQEIIMYYMHCNKKMNRGFVFVEFVEHRFAARARKILRPGSLVLWGAPIFVEWSEPIPEVDVEIISKVKKLFLSKLDVELSNDDLWKHLTNVVPGEGIIKVHKILDYAFVHFNSRKSAEEAMELMQGLVINGENVEVSWARPTFYSKAQQINRPPTHFCQSLPAKSKQLLQSRERNIVNNGSNILNSRNLSEMPYGGGSTSTSTIVNHFNRNFTAPPSFNQFSHFSEDVNKLGINYGLPNFQMREQLPWFYNRDQTNNLINSDENPDFFK